MYCEYTEKTNFLRVKRTYSQHEQSILVFVPNDPARTIVVDANLEPLERVPNTAHEGSNSDKIPASMLTYYLR